ncbi:MAG: RluA family pseudouridine synthase [Candidatus Electrothrix sp. AR4]|nr:RluA family pseudouridine synthase [Candidatus Electrothrix sp. AR4]
MLSDSRIYALRPLFRINGRIFALNSLEVIHTDQYLAVVNKPGGLLAVPGRGPTKQDCVVSRIKTLFPDSIAQPAVHRLDMATSGLMVLAFTADTHRDLSRQFSERQVEKQYIALLEGLVEKESGEIILRFRLDPGNRPYQIYDPIQGKTGITQWRILNICSDQSQPQTRIAFTPLTGRTHQLRLHAAHELGLGCPIIGDSLYGNGKRGDSMLLHATRLAFTHPITDKWLEFSSPVPF